MQCPQCHFDNPPQMKFCGECGAKLQILCPKCGTEAIPGFKFCGECGTPLTAPPPAASQPAAPQPAAPQPVAPRPTPPQAQPAATESEIKQVTVLCCDLVCATAANHLDPELMHTLLNRFFELAQVEVGRYGGTINQYLSQGFMALYGVPIAHEDHAHRAVLTAVGLQDRLAAQSADIEARHGVEWKGRMGLDTGAVVVGGIGDMAVGETPARAGRLRDFAQPGTIVVSDNTAKLVETHMQLEGPRPVPGEDKAQAWQVIGTGSLLTAASPFREETLSPFVGRVRELAVLDELRELTLSDQGQVVGLVGEAGSGKSRLLYEFRKTFRGQRVSYLRGQCLSYGSGVPYLPLITMIRGASSIGETDSPEVVTAKMRASLERVGTDPEESLPYFLRLLGVREGTEVLDNMEPQSIQTRTFATMRRMLLDAGRGALVVMELEDLHWIDQTSEDFLASLVEVMTAARMLLLLTYRAGYQPRWLEKSYATQITLQRLSDRDSQQLVSAILQRAELGKELASNILEKAEGNPFFLEELARSLVEHGKDKGGEVPNTIQDVLMARIDRMPGEHKRLLQTASVLGRECSLELLEAIWDRPQPLAPLLEDLQRWEYLYKAPSEDQAVRFFRHALTQEVAYQSLLSGRRRELHAAVVTALEALYADRLEDAYDRLIYHYPKAGEPEKTVLYLSLFAARAARDYAHAEAAKALREALVHGAKLPEKVRERRLIELLLQLAESLLPLARFPETLELFEDYGELVERLDDPCLNAKYFFWLAHTHTYLGNQEETRQNAQRSIAAAQACGDEATEGKACYVLGRDGFWSGKFSEGIKYSLRAVVLLERSGEPWWQGQAYWVAGFNHYVLGQFEEGIEALQRAYSIGEALDDYRLDTSWSLGHFYASLGEWEAGIEQCRKGLERSQDPLNTAVAMGFLGHAYLEKGDLPQAIESLRESVERLRQAGMQQMLGWFLAFLAEAYLLTDHLEEARKIADQGFEITRNAEFRYGVGLAQRVLGRIAQSAERLGEAKIRFHQALETFTSLEVPFEVGRTRLDLAQLAHADGNAEESARELSESHRLFSELRVPKHLTRTIRIASNLGIALRTYGSPRNK